MNDAGLIAMIGPLLFAGIAASLHCVGMCGPILAAFSQAFAGDRELTRGRRIVEFTAYHAGRIWTYAVLGFMAGLAGRGLRDGGAALGWQRPVSIVIATGVILSGVLLLGLIPGGRFESLISGCGIRRLYEMKWFLRLLHGPELLARFLLGAVMGLLPCGLVYAMLVMVAALPTPLHAAAGMLFFGLGTVPSLSAVLIVSGAASGWVRRYGTRLVAILLIVSGVFMLGRTLMVPTDPAAHDHHRHLAASATTDDPGLDKGLKYV